MEENVFKALQGRLITVISTGHKDTLLKYHPDVLDLGAVVEVSLGERQDSNSSIGLCVS